MDGCEFSLREYIEYLATRCPDLSHTVRHLYSDICFQSVVSQRNLDYSAPCTACDPDGCHLAEEAPLWNEFFWAIDVELREIRPGRLALCWLEGPSLFRSFATGTPCRTACVLFHFLLSRHRCIEFVELQESGVPCSHFLFCDGLRLSRGLKHIRLYYFSFDTYPSGDVIGALGATVTTLDTLEIVGMRLSSDSVNMLCELLGRCEVLHTLAFLENSLPPAGAQALLNSLAGHRSLRKVQVDQTFVIGDCCHSLGYLVSHNANLEELILSQSIAAKETSAPNFEPLFLALCDRRAQLQRLTIWKFILHESDMRNLSEALGVNERLGSLRLLCRGSSQEAFLPLAQIIMHNKSLVDICVSHNLLKTSSFQNLARAAEVNTTLKNLVFDEASMTANEAMCLLDALSVNMTLQKLDLGTLCQPGISQFLKTVRDKALSKRLRFTAVHGTAAALITTLRSIYKPASVSFEPTDAITKPVLRKLSTGLCGEAFLASLRVRLTHKVDCEMALTLSTVLASSRLLKEACLDFPVKGSEAIVILQGIGKSRSLSELTLRGWEFGSRAAVAFSDMLCSSRTVNKIVFAGLTSMSSTCLGTQLPRGLASNYTLLTLCGLEQRKDRVFQVRDCLRRNHSLLHQASRFVLPPCSNIKKAASAFEKVSRSRAFLAEVAQLAGLTDAEASELVTHRRRYLDENFFAVAGVVQDDVECHPSSAVQIDQIGFDCWLEIRQYLRLDDILDAA